MEQEDKRNAFQYTFKAKNQYFFMQIVSFVINLETFNNENLDN